MSKRLKIVLAVVVLVVAAAGAGLWWFFKDDAPDEVSIETAVESVQDDDTTTTTAGELTDGVETATTDPAAPADADGIEGDWVVDTESGDFDYESATGTFAGFRIAEELSGIGSTTAVGRTGGVTGGITIEGTTVTAGSFEVDLTAITTNETRRDDRVQQALETGTFPTATFTLTEPIELGDGAADGETITATAVGDLTIHGVTQSIEMAVEAQLVNSTVVIVGSTPIVFSDYGVEVPSSPIVLSVSDDGTLELQLLLVSA